MLLDHTHLKLNSNVAAIGGEYVFLKEGIVRFQEKTILYYVGCAVLNSTCCGNGGVCFSRVPGVVYALKYKTDNTGSPVSRVEPITDKTFQKEICKFLQGKEMVDQVEF